MASSRRQIRFLFDRHYYRVAKRERTSIANTPAKASDNTNATDIEYQSNETELLQDDAEVCSNNHKKHKRKEQNREAQRAFRDRKEKLVSKLEDKIKRLEERKIKKEEEEALAKENQDLLQEIDRLKDENVKLKLSRFRLTLADLEDPDWCEKDASSSTTSSDQLKQQQQKTTSTEDMLLRSETASSDFFCVSNTSQQSLFGELPLAQDALADICAGTSCALASQQPLEPFHPDPFFDLCNDMENDTSTTNPTDFISYDVDPNAFGLLANETCPYKNSNAPAMDDIQKLLVGMRMRQQDGSRTASSSGSSSVHTPCPTTQSFDGISMVLDGLCSRLKALHFMDGVDPSALSSPEVRSYLHSLSDSVNYPDNPDPSITSHRT